MERESSRLLMAQFTKANSLPEINTAKASKRGPTGQLRKESSRLTNSTMVSGKMEQLAASEKSRMVNSYTEEFTVQ